MNVKEAIDQLCRDSHDTAVRKGWYDTPRTPLELLMLVVSELAEAVEEYRDPAVNLAEVRYRDSDGKPEGFGVELADAVIRIADLCGHLGIDLGEAVEVKASFNETRPHRHGNKRA